MARFIHLHRSCSLVLGCVLVLDNVVTPSQRILSHFSNEPFVLDSKFTYVPSGNLKPSGLWLSDESDYGWKDWCNAEGFHLESLNHETKVQINLDDVLWIKTEEALNKFSENFSIPIHEELTNMSTINWPLVQSKWKGLIISPYQWNSRLGQKCFWYYGWDCASGVIWDLSAVSLFKERVA